MAWIELHQTLPRHPKLIRLAARLQIHTAQAAGHVVFLWLWTLDYCPNGGLSDFGAAEIAAASSFTGDADLFLEALVACGWIDEDRAIHNWHEYAGRLVEERARDKERKRAARESYKSRMSVGCPADGDGTAAGRRPYPTQPNPTQPNPTVPEDNGAPSAPRTRFTPPTREELDIESAKIGLPKAQVDLFVAHYASNGWKVGRNPMKSWPHALAGWATRWRGRESQPALGFGRRGPLPKTPDDAGF